MRGAILTLLCAVGVATARELPESGDAAERFARFDATIRAFAVSNEVGAITAAVSEHGRIVHVRAFGCADRQRTKPLPVTARFRVASISKPITAAAVKALIRDGTLQPDTRVLDVLTSPPWPQAKDERWRDVTIRHLLEHRGGWDRDTWGDPMFMQARIRKETGRDPARPDDVVRWMLGQPLQFDPGAKSVYANFGYCVLGRVIETVARASYLDVVRKTVATPCGIASWDLARGGAKPLPDEVWYDFGAEKGEYFRIGLMDAHGGLVSTASDLCRFMSRYWLNGEIRNGGRGRARFFGSLPATTAIASQRGDGIDFAVLLNRRSASNDEPWHEVLERELDRTLDAAP